jgi:hypothetical protein
VSVAFVSPESGPDEPRRHPASVAQPAEQPARAENSAVRHHRLGQRALRRPRLEVPVAQTNCDGPRGESIATQVRRRTRHESQQFALDVLIIMQVPPERLIATETSVHGAMGDVSVVPAMHAIPQPCRLALAHPALERRQIVTQHVLDGDETAGGQALLKFGAHEGNVRERAGAQESRFITMLNDQDAIPLATRLGAIDRHLGDQLVGAAAD